MYYIRRKRSFEIKRTFLKAELRVEALDRRNSPSGVPDKAELRVEALDRRNSPSSVPDKTELRVEALDILTFIYLCCILLYRNKLL